LPKLTIYSHDDAQVLLIDADLKVVDRGVGQLTVDVLPGIYKVKVERGGGAAERLLELSGDETVYQLVDRFPAVAPIEDFLGGKAFEINNLAAKAMGLDWSRAHAPPGWEGWLAAPDAPGLLILAHRLKSDAGGGGPLAGLSVKPWGGEASVALAVRAFASETDNETWSATWLPLKPGCYVLEIEDGSQKVRQAAYVAPQGWQTRVFMRRRSWLAGAPSAEKSAPRCDWFDVSIQMARRNDPVVYQDHLVTVEVARNALELKTEIVGVVAAASPSYSLSFKERKVVEAPSLTLIADGLACRKPNPQAMEVIWENVTRIVEVTDEEIAHAMRSLYEDTHNLAEGAGAAALAGSLKEKDLHSGKRVGIILTGGNIDREAYAQVLTGAS